jgi:hypothetical protein
VYFTVNTGYRSPILDGSQDFLWGMPITEIPKESLGLERSKYAGVVLNLSLAFSGRGVFCLLEDVRLRLACSGGWGLLCNHVRWAIHQSEMHASQVFTDDANCK